MLSATMFGKVLGGCFTAGFTVNYDAKNKPHMIKKWLMIVGVSTLMPAWGSANALDYPNRPVKIVVPVSVGGGGDYIARAWSNELSQRLGQPVVIDNRGGAGTVIGTQLVANAAADGYTLLLTNQALDARFFHRVAQ